MPEFQTNPGMRDILHPDSARWREFTVRFAEVVGRAGYGQIITPLLEDLGVFTRIGDATDVVTKEMYDFVDKGERHVALRPELTAGVCRAFAQHRPPTPFKVWYSGSNFRYEKPQRGRYRQFDQVGVEVLGVDDPHLDVEVIALGWEFLTGLGLTKLTLLLNSLGEPEDRARYVQALAEYFGSRRADLSPQSRSTLERNPLRVLDSKRPEDAEIIAAAPRIESYLSAGAEAHFAEVRAGLERLGISYVLDPRLVRGLDYYRRTTFEYRGDTLDSAQNALGGGGRYDGLVEDLGGPPTAGIGFAIGLDRTLLACEDEGVFPAVAQVPDVFVIDLVGGREALAVTAAARAAGLRAERAYEQRSLRAQMKAADRSGAQFAVIIGEEEHAAGTVLLRSLRRDSPPDAGGQEQFHIARTEVVALLLDRCAAASDPPAPHSLPKDP